MDNKMASDVKLNINSFKKLSHYFHKVPVLNC